MSAHKPRRTDFQCYRKDLAHHSRNSVINRHSQIGNVISATMDIDAISKKYQISRGIAKELGASNGVILLIQSKPKRDVSDTEVTNVRTDQIMRVYKQFWPNNDSDDAFNLVKQLSSDEHQRFQTVLWSSQRPVVQPKKVMPSIAKLSRPTVASQGKSLATYASTGKKRQNYAPRMKRVDPFHEQISMVMDRTIESTVPAPNTLAEYKSVASSISGILAVETSARSETERKMLLDLLRTLQIFQKVSSYLLLQYADAAEILTLPENHILFFQGDEPKYW
jgi:uncharacterized membrane protein